VRDAKQPDPLKWVDPVDIELYVQDPYRGTILLHAQDQKLCLDMHSADGGHAEREHALGAMRKGWIATAFTQLGPGALLLSGVQSDEDQVLALRVLFDPGTCMIESIEDEFVSRTLSIPASLDLLPDHQRVAILDREASSLHVYDLKKHTLRLVADRVAAPKLEKMKYVHAWKLGEHGVSLWATQVPEDQASSRLIGTSVEFLDRDGDGVFETTR
jgi:hypothetical protein